MLKKIIEDEDDEHIEAQDEAAMTKDKNEEADGAQEVEDDSDQFVTMEDFRVAYKDIKNRYRDK